MKRCAWRVCVFLLLGAIVNIAVAWGCALSFSTIWNTSSFRPATPSELRWITSLGEASHESETSVTTGFGRKVVAISLDDPVMDQQLAAYRAQQGGLILGTFAPWPSARRIKAGFPLIALESMHLTHTLTWEKANGVAHAPPESIGGWLLERDSYMNEERSIPLIPVWPGFAVNTVLYAGVVWLVLVGLTAMRRASRIKRGLCSKCAYDLRGRPADAATCPECGGVT